MRILAAEDETIFANALEMLIESAGYELIAVAKNSEEFIRLFVSTRPDLVLMDINIEGSQDGITLAEYIYKSTFAVPVIFVTAYADESTFLRAKLTHPAAYLSKPIDLSALQRSIALALQNFAPRPAGDNGKDFLVRDSFFLKIDGRLVKFAYDEINYILSDDKYCHIHTANKDHLVRAALKDIMLKLPVSDFMQTHKGVLINVNKILTIHIKENSVQMTDGKELPIAKSFKANLLERINLVG